MVRGVVTILGVRNHPRLLGRFIAMLQSGKAPPTPERPDTRRTSNAVAAFFIQRQQRRRRRPTFSEVPTEVQKFKQPEPIYHRRQRHRFNEHPIQRTLPKGNSANGRKIKQFYK